MRFREAAWSRVSVNHRAFQLFIQLPPITMLLQMFDGLARHIPPFLLGQALPQTTHNLSRLAQGKGDAVRQMFSARHIPHHLIEFSQKSFCSRVNSAPSTPVRIQRFNEPLPNRRVEVVPLTKYLNSASAPWQEVPFPVSRYVLVVVPACDTLL
jgi:hypothetical protein